MNLIITFYFIQDIQDIHSILIIQMQYKHRHINTPQHTI